MNKSEIIKAFAEGKSHRDMGVYPHEMLAVVRKYVADTLNLTEPLICIRLPKAILVKAEHYRLDIGRIAEQALTSIFEYLDKEGKTWT